MGPLACPGTDGDAKGFVLQVSNPKLENGTTDTRAGLITFPQNIQNGYIQGFYPAFKVQAGDRFRSIINCEAGATNCYVAFRLDFQTGSDPIKTLWGPFLERHEGKYYSLDVDLSSLAGKDVKFILTVLAAGVATGDRALWVGPIIYRPGGVPATTTVAPGTATATATNTGAPAATDTPTATETATATATATATNTGAPAATDTPTATETATATATTGAAAKNANNTTE